MTIETPKELSNKNQKGEKNSGRPKIRWTVCLDEDLKAKGLSVHGKKEGRKEGRQRLILEEIDRDQEKWKDAIEKSVAGKRQRMT